MTKEKTNNVYQLWGVMGILQQRDPNTTLVQKEWSTWIPCWFSKVRKAARAHLPGKGEILCLSSKKVKVSTNAMKA